MAADEVTFETAARLLSAADAIRGRLGASGSARGRSGLEGIADRARETLGHATYEAIAVEGRALSLQEAAEEAARVA
ncbi:MAG: hypothetical protein M3O88_06700 [Actinomycetota bacterium]|nr:hypothetical protein [Actinomycetota bacterium]